jgi:hypothetical protein
MIAAEREGLQQFEVDATSAERVLQDGTEARQCQALLYSLFGVAETSGLCCVIAYVQVEADGVLRNWNGL